MGGKEYGTWYRRPGFLFTLDHRGWFGSSEGQLSAPSLLSPATASPEKEDWV